MTQFYENLIFRLLAIVFSLAFNAIGAHGESQFVSLSYGHAYKSQIYTCFIADSKVTSEELPLEFREVSLHLGVNSDADVYLMAFVLRLNTKQREFSIKFLHKDIVDYATSKFKNLNSLLLNFAGIKRMASNAFEKCEKFLDISLAFNKITEIHHGSFKSCRKLKRLSLAGNKISQIRAETFEGLDNLEDLNLLENKLPTLDENVFKNTPKLIRLQLTVAKLNEIPPKTFTNLKNLEKIKIQHSRASTLHPMVLAELKHLKTVIGE